MPLFARNFQELVADSLEELARNTNITKLSAGGKARSILESVSKRLEEQYDIFDVNLARAFVSSAPGQYLDLIGELFGVSRLPAESATVSEELQIMKFSVDGGGTFGSINNSTAIIVRAGVRISSQAGASGAVYRIIQDKVLNAADTEDYVAVEALRPGEESNVGAGSLVFHTFTDYADSANKTLIVTNTNPISNGRNFESDSNFRFRIVNRALEAEAGNATAIRLAILSTPGIADVLLLRHYRGIGTWGAILKSVTPTVSQELIDNVTSNVFSATSFGHMSFIRKPKETGVTMRLTVHYSDRLDDDALQETEDSLEEAITDHINNLDLGEELLVNRMVAELFAVDDNIANFGEPGKSVDEIFVHKETTLGDNKIRTKLLGDYFPENDERVIIEPSVQNPITFVRKFIRR